MYRLNLDPFAGKHRSLSGGNGTSSRGAQARLAACASHTVSPHHFMMASFDGTDSSELENTNSPVIIPTEGESGEQDPQDTPRTPGQATKAALKQFEFVPRGSLSEYRIP